MKRYFVFLSIILIAGLLLVACGGEDPTPTPEPEPAAEPVEEPTEVPTEEPTEEPAPEPTEEPAEETMEEPETKTIYVGPALAECTGVAPQQCLQIKESPDEEYQLWYYPIEGFEYEEGYEYELVVEVHEDPDAPADASTINLVLVEEVSKTPVETMADMRTDNLDGETITFYHFGDLSGAYAAITSPLIHGFEDAVADINANGGIRGANVEIEFSDTAGSVDEAVAAYDRFTSDNDNILVMFTYGSGEVEALASRFVEDQIPNLTAGLSSVGIYGPDSGYTFGYAPIYPDQFGLFLDWLTVNWADVKPASAGDEIKLAYISWPTAYGQGALTPETRAYAESLGVEIVAEELFDLSPTADTTSAILNAQAAGANTIWTNTLAFGPASVLNGLSALGLQDQFFVGANNWAMDLSLYAFLQDPSLAVGMTSPFPNLWWTDVDHPGIQYAEELFTANERPVSDHNVGYLLTLAGTDIAVTAIEAAIDKVGFDNLTGADVYEALIGLGQYDALDGLMRVDYSGDSRTPHVAQLRQIQGGPDAFVLLQDWTETPDLRPADNFSSQ